MNRIHLQRGVTLVELMVGLTIGLVLSLVASSIYLTTNETSRATKAHGDINETGKLALDIVGREIEKAGFYPAQYPTDASNDKVNGSFTNTKSPGASSPYNAGLFGCDGGHYDPSTGNCQTKVDGAPDGIYINYFATEEFGPSSNLGNSNDCNGKPVSADTANSARAAAKLPLFVSNRYGLTDKSDYIDADGNTIKVRSLGCHGNGVEGDTDLQPQLMGIEDLVFRYGVYAAGDTDTTQQSPDQFLTATQVTALSTLSGLSPWQRVSAVKICILVRSLQNARAEDISRSYVDCRGSTKTQSASDRTIYKRFERVYAVRNNLTGTL